MAGTVPNLPLSMQFDKDTGKQLKNGKLYVFQADTDTPQNAYKDTGLALLHPNPIPLDGAGRIPNFYLADGYVRLRLESATGIVQFDERIVLVIGPSSGSGGSVTVDAAKQFETGDMYWRAKGGARSGWVRANGRTIGSATSGATERANADCQALFLDTWNSFPDSICPVPGGRGVDAATDWAANKQITLPDMRGAGPMGLDDMGNAALGAMAGVPVVAGGVTTPGSKVGTNTHTLANSEVPATGVTVNITDPGHPHYQQCYTGAGDTANPKNTYPASSSGFYNAYRLGTSGDVMGPTSTNTTGITASGTVQGSGGAHNNTHRAMLGTWLMKL